MKYPHFSIDANIGLFIVIGVFLLVGLFNATKLGYIQKKHVPVLIILAILLIVFLFILK